MSSKLIGNLLLPLLLLTACGDEGPNEELTYAELLGNWPLLSLVFTSDANPSTSFDFQAEGGSGSLTFQADTTFLFVLLQNPGSPTESASGSVELAGNTIVLRDDADPDPALLSGTRSGQRLIFETEDAEYDFDGDGTDEPARVDVIFEH